MDTTEKGTMGGHPPPPPYQNHQPADAAHPHPGYAMGQQQTTYPHGYHHPPPHGYIPQHHGYAHQPHGYVPLNPGYGPPHPVYGTAPTPAPAAAAHNAVTIINNNTGQQAPTHHLTTVIVPKRGVNHLLHFIITLIFPPWILVWIFLCLTDQ